MWNEHLNVTLHTPKHSITAAIVSDARLFVSYICSCIQPNQRNTDRKIEKKKKKEWWDFSSHVNFWTVLVNVAGHYMCGEPCVFCPFVSYY